MKFPAPRTKPCYTERRQGDVRHSEADISRARRLLDYQVEVDFLEGLWLLAQNMVALNW